MNINILKKYVCLCVMLMLCAVPAWSATTTVSTVAELTSTISSAASGDTIILAAGTYALTSTLIINKSITLRGHTSSDTIIQRSSGASDKFSNITISGASAEMVILQNLTIRSADATNNGGGINYTTNGTLSIDNCIIANNVVDYYYGGGIYNKSGTANITNSTITGNTAGNTAGNHGREIYNNQGTTSALNTLIWNSVSNAVISGTVTLTNCAVPSLSLIHI